MKKLYPLLAGTALCATPATLLAQDSSYVEPSAHIELSKTTPEIHTILSKARPVEPQSVSVPKFVIRSTNNKFIFAIGGHINPIIGWDLGNNLYEQDDAGLNFTTAAIPFPSRHGAKSDFFINALNTQIDFQIVGFGGTENAITAYVKIGTNNNDAHIKLKRAYINYRGFTAGQVATLMEDGDACQPTTIDPQGPCGEVSTTVFEVNYKSPSYNGFQYAVGVSKPSYYSSNGVYLGYDHPRYRGEQVADVSDVSQAAPDVPAWIQYGKGGNRVRLSAMLRCFKYRDLIADKLRYLVGYGVMLSGNLQPCDAVNICYQAAYGRGFGAYIQDIAGMPLSFTPSNDNIGHMSANPMMGLDLGATFNLSKKWQINVVASQARIWNVSSYCTAADATANYKYALYAAGNIFYNITPYLQWGMEYVWGRRMTWNQGGANDSRIQTQIKFTI